MSLSVGSADQPQWTFYGLAILRAILLDVKPYHIGQFVFRVAMLFAMNADYSVDHCRFFSGEVDRFNLVHPSLGHLDAEAFEPVLGNDPQIACAADKRTHGGLPPRFQLGCFAQIKIVKMRSYIASRH